MRAYRESRLEFAARFVSPIGRNEQILKGLFKFVEIRFWLTRWLPRVFSMKSPSGHECRCFKRTLLGTPTDILDNLKSLP